MSHVADWIMAKGFKYTFYIANNKNHRTMFTQNWHIFKGNKAEHCFLKHNIYIIIAKISYFFVHQLTLGILLKWSNPSKYNSNMHKGRPFWDHMH